MRSVEFFSVFLLTTSLTISSSSAQTCSAANTDLMFDPNGIILNFFACNQVSRPPNPADLSSVTSSTTNPSTAAKLSWCTDLCAAANCLSFTYIPNPIFNTGAVCTLKKFAGAGSSTFSYGGGRTTTCYVGITTTQAPLLPFVDARRWCSPYPALTCLAGASNVDWSTMGGATLTYDTTGTKTEAWCRGLCVGSCAAYTFAPAACAVGSGANEAAPRCWTIPALGATAGRPTNNCRCSGLPPSRTPSTSVSNQATASAAATSSASASRQASSSRTPSKMPSVSTTKTGAASVSASSTRSRAASASVLATASASSQASSTKTISTTSTASLSSSRSRQASPSVSASGTSQASPSRAVSVSIAASASISTWNSLTGSASPAPTTSLSGSVASSPSVSTSFGSSPYATPSNGASASTSSSVSGSPAQSGSVGATGSSTQSSSQSSAPSATSSPGASISGSSTSTGTPASSSSSTTTLTASPSLSAAASASSSQSASATASHSQSASATATSSVTRSLSRTGSASASPSGTASVQASVSSSCAATATESASFVPPSAAASETNTPSTSASSIPAPPPSGTLIAQIVVDVPPWASWAPVPPSTFPDLYDDSRRRRRRRVQEQQVRGRKDGEESDRHVPGDLEFVEDDFAAAWQARRRQQQQQQQWRNESLRARVERILGGAALEPNWLIVNAVLPSTTFTVRLSVVGGVNPSSGPPVSVSCAPSNAFTLVDAPATVDVSLSSSTTLSASFGVSGVRLFDPHASASAASEALLADVGDGGALGLVTCTAWVRDGASGALLPAASASVPVVSMAQTWTNIADIVVEAEGGGLLVSSWGPSLRLPTPISNMSGVDAFRLIRSVATCAAADDMRLSVVLPGASNITLVADCCGAPTGALSMGSAGAANPACSSGFFPTTQVFLGALPCRLRWISMDSYRLLRIETPPLEDVCTAAAGSYSCPNLQLRIMQQTPAGTWEVLRQIAALPAAPSLATYAATASYTASLAVFASTSCPPFCGSIGRALPIQTFVLGDYLTIGLTQAPPGGLFGGVRYVQSCSSVSGNYTDPNMGACSNFSSPLARSCAYGTGVDCVPCASLTRTGICPGGYSLFTGPGEWVSFPGSRQVFRCLPPATERCVGWNASLNAAQCGVGYQQGSLACGKCAPNYYTNTADGSCVACASSNKVILVLLSVAQLLGSLLGLGLFIFLVVYGVTRRSGGTIRGGLKRAAAFVESTWLVLNIVAQVGTNASPGLPPALRSMYAAFSSVQFKSITLNPACLSTSLFYGEVLQFCIVGALLLLIPILHYWDSAKLSLPPDTVLASTISVRAMSSKSTRFWAALLRAARRGVFTALSVMYALVMNTAFGSITCSTVTMPVRAYLQLSGDGSTLTGFHMPLISPERQIFCESFPLANDCASTLAQLDAGIPVRLLSDDSFVVCGENGHASIEFVALVVIGVYGLLYPLLAWYLLSRRIGKVLAWTGADELHAILARRDAEERRAYALHERANCCTRACRRAAMLATSWVPAGYGPDAKKGGRLSARARKLKSPSSTAAVAAKVSAASAVRMIDGGGLSNAEDLTAIAVMTSPLFTKKTATASSADAAPSLSGGASSPSPSAEGPRGQNDAAARAALRAASLLSGAPPGVRTAQQLVDASKAVIQEGTLAHFAGGEFRPSRFWFRIIDFLLFLGLALCHSLSAGLVGGTPATPQTTMAIALALLLACAVLILLQRPFLRANRWLLAIRAYALLLSAYCVVLNYVGALEDASAPSLKYAAMSYVAFAACMGLILTLIGAFIYSLTIGAEEEVADVQRRLAKERSARAKETSSKPRRTRLSLSVVAADVRAAGEEEEGDGGRTSIFSLWEAGPSSAAELETRRASDAAARLSKAKARASVVPVLWSAVSKKTASGGGGGGEEGSDDSARRRTVVPGSPMMASASPRSEMLPLSIAYDGTSPIADAAMPTQQRSKKMRRLSAGAFGPRPSSFSTANPMAPPRGDTDSSHSSNAIDSDSNPNATGAVLSRRGAFLPTSPDRSSVHQSAKEDGEEGGSADAGTVAASHQIAQSEMLRVGFRSKQVREDGRAVR